MMNKTLAPFIRWNDTPYGRIRATTVGGTFLIACNDIGSALVPACGRTEDEMQWLVLAVAKGFHIWQRIHCSTGSVQTNGNPFNMIAVGDIASLKLNAFFSQPDIAAILDGIAAFDWIVTEDGHGH